MRRGDRLGLFGTRAVPATGLVAFVLMVVLSMTVPTARANAACSVPNQISNGQVADATVLMGNLNAISDCINSVQNSVVSPSGTPAAGNLPVFSSPTTISPGNVSGDCTTSGTLAVTCTKTNGTPLGPFATGTDAGHLTGTISVNRFDNGNLADSSHFLRGDGVWALPSGTGGGSTDPSLIPHRYWIIQFSGSTDWAFSAAKIEMRPTRGAADQCVGGTAIASASDGGAAANAFDANPATFWSTTQGDSGNVYYHPTWIGYDFGAGNAKAVEEVAITARNDPPAQDQTPTWGRVMFSDNGAVYYTAFEFLFATVPTLGQTMTAANPRS